MEYNISKKDNRVTFITQDGTKDDPRKKVICIISNTKGLFHEFADKNFHLNCTCDEFFWNNAFKPQLFKDTSMPNKFVGVAICSENDEFDEELGRTIAFSRAKDNLNKCFFKRASTYINTLDDWINEALDIVNAYGEKLSANSAKRHAYIRSRIGEENGTTESSTTTE